MWKFQSLPALLTLYANAKKAETLEALARTCGLPPKTLCETVEAYNAAARGDAEDAFRKAPEFRAEMARGPWRALDISLGSKTFPCAVITFGGLRVEPGSRRQVRRAGGGAGQPVDQEQDEEDGRERMTPGVLRPGASVRSAGGAALRLGPHRTIPPPARRFQ